jgi:dihydrofolate reductase
MTMIRAILACDEQGGIGKNGNLPWPHNQKDLSHFKKLTTNATVVMGKGTWNSGMPKPLPNRENIVVTTDPNFVAPGATILSENVSAHLTSLAKDRKVFVIGGAVLFESLIDSITLLHLARISGNYDCDTFLPLDQITEKFELIDSVAVDNMTTFQTYLRM